MITAVDEKSSKRLRQVGRRKDDQNNAVISEFGRRVTRHQPWPMVLINEQLTPFFYNPAAELWAQSIRWLRVSDRKLEVLDTELARKLRHALSHWPNGEESTLHLSEGAHALSLTRFSVGALRAPVYVVTPGAKDDGAARREYLQVTYGLTAAEADVVSLLYDGLSKDSIASRRRTTVHAVRQHLKPAYKKLGVRSQWQMVKKVSDWEVRVRVLSDIGERG